MSLLNKVITLFERYLPPEIEFEKSVHLGFLSKKQWDFENYQVVYLLGHVMLDMFCAIEAQAAI